MLAQPHTLSLVTTHQCTAACEHCCFSCTPKVLERIPSERLLGLIDEAKEVPSVRVVVFTGGECFLLGEELDRLVARATGHGFVTRCVTNGYWSTSRLVAERRLARLTSAGLKEINFSTGPFHARFVPLERIIHGLCASLAAGLTTLVNVETFEADGFALEAITEHPELASDFRSGRLRVNRNVWIENGAQAPLSHLPEHSRFREDRKGGCSTVLQVLAVTPGQSLVSCCGLHLEKIPDLHLGSVRERSLSELLADSPDDFLKIWLHVEGPERILEFVQRHDPEYAPPVRSVHPCETCLHLYRDEAAKRIISEHYGEVEAEVVQLYLAGLAAAALKSNIDRQLRGPYLSGAD